ncbi:hypothetical protein [Mucilaginibacter sp.]|uniref:hypothetical protein n=1 Tax=Mucilaginibacter sp. TaxID=1882438 RepID=UPI00261BF23E|nr:hypothetical protein [Mucilaginibacter sp.]MDB5032645.1 alpha/beta-hydrolase superfamily protein [Mucilaginibacter sp.]
MKRLSLISLLLFIHTLIFAQQYIADSKNGCKIWDVAYAPTHKATWSGNCVEGFASGKGTLTWLIEGKEVARYTGEMNKGLQNGYGIFSFNGGKSSKGYFIDGEVTGLDSSSIKLLKRNAIAINDSTHIFDNFLPDKSPFYYALTPQIRMKGALVLLPSTWERPESVLNNNAKLSQLALKEGLVVIVPSTNMHIYLDEPVTDFLNLVFNDAIQRYQIPKDKFVIGGYSLGGIISLRYAEVAFEHNHTAIIPAAVYSVDGPVDFANMYRQFEREIEKNVSTMAVNEAKYYLDGMRKYFKGTPSENPANYIKNSVYSRSEKQGGNAKFLHNVPFRIYSDPDIDWAMKNRQRDLYDMNAPDQSALIIELTLQGNTNAKFINALGKGYRLDGTRHPHSWNIVDANECITWIKDSLKL